MRCTLCLTLTLLLLGCAESTRTEKTAAREAEHPQVIVQGVDGTMISGELLNGSITIDSGQGELTLLTDHVHSISMAQDADKVDSDSVKVTGKVKETRFQLRNEHGVFTLAKDRLRKIEFISNPGGTVMAESGTTVTARTASAAVK
jgi:hypothetical protein